MAKQDHIRLECTTGGHNKFYEIWIENPEHGSWELWTRYGSIGKDGVMGRKAFADSYDSIKYNYNDVRKEKLGKGYVLAGQAKKSNPMLVVNKDALISKKDIKDPGAMPMQPTAAPVEEADKYASASEWVMQEKLNGRFVRIVSEMGGDVRAYNKKLDLTTLPATIREVFLERSCVVDGELIGDKFYMFDALRIGGSTIISLGTLDRLKKLHIFNGGLTSHGHVFALDYAIHAGHKVTMLEGFRKHYREGVIFKLKDAPYTPGKTDNIEKAVCVKIKFWKEVSALARKWTDKSSIEVGLYEGGKVVGVGKVTVHEKYKPQLLKLPCVVRVKYLYATKDNQLYQASLDPDDAGVIVRDDQAYEECLMSQLKFEGKADDPPKFRRNLIL